MLCPYDGKPMKKRTQRIRVCRICGHEETVEKKH